VPRGVVEPGLRCACDDRFRQRACRSDLEGSSFRHIGAWPAPT
jgi:hypothetical protein